MSPGRDVGYLLPLRWDADDPAELADLTAYLRSLAGEVAVTVVDGSPPAGYARHEREWADLGIAHLPPDRDLDFAMGKSNGVWTGLRRPGPDRLVIADDDVRWDLPTLRRAVALLERADVVRPQNVFRPAPWHARWDTGRTLLARAVAADWPGTLVVRRSALLAAGGYDGDALFENLELVRSVQAAGGTELAARDLYVPRRPPTGRHFRSQRVRQAYDSFAQPGRLAVELAVLPAALLVARRPRLLAAGAAAVVGLAELGRRRDGGAGQFPATAALWAPVWLAERAVCVWIAAGSRLRGGVPYRGRRLRLAARPQGRGSGSAAARNLPALCVPSQNGLREDSPQRHSATVRRPA